MRSSSPSPRAVARRLAISALALMMMVAAAGLVAGAARAASPPSAKPGKIAPSVKQKLEGSGRALSGDTLVVQGVEIRLMGIDAPDTGETCKNKYGSVFDCFAISTKVMTSLIENETVVCYIGDQDRNGRKEGECFVRGVDLANAMIARGWAFAFRSLSQAYGRSESYAQSKRLGLWAGQVERPWQWRSRKQQETAR